MEYLPGGRNNQIARIENSVHRPSGFWSQSVHALLHHVRRQGFWGAPLPLALINFMESEASSGNEAFQTNIKDGHHLIYLADIAYLKQYQKFIEDGLA
jgi:hypothetical protein